VVEGREGEVELEASDVDVTSNTRSHADTPPPTPLLAQ